ncbi:MAG: hypothetical protein Q8M31_18285, partial [Beijerinckiaceae bacterium]|nr:hypothetical protein [Beijerinckiaceae bacterium]
MPFLAHGAAAPSTRALCHAVCCKPMAWTAQSPARRRIVAPRAQLGSGGAHPLSSAGEAAALTQEARAKAGGGASRVVDVHCHFFSDDLKAAWRQGGGHLPGNIA